MTGPRAGPIKVIMEKSAMALPRSAGPQMSTKTPGALLRAALAKVPVRNRPINSPAKLGVNAQRKLKAMYNKNVP